jgi:hypothetical protein
MLTLSLFRAFVSAVPWMLDLATRVLARMLNMPEPLLHNTGAFVFAQVQAVENSVGKTLRPIRRLRRVQKNRVRTSLRRPAR